MVVGYFKTRKLDHRRDFEAGFKRRLLVGRLILKNKAK